MKKRIVIWTALAALTLTLAACGPKEGPGETGEPVPTPAHTAAPTGAPASTATPAPEATPAAPAPSPTPLPDEEPVWGERSFVKEYTAEDGIVLLTAECTLPAVTNARHSSVGAVIDAWYAAELRTFQADADSAAEWAATDYELSRGTDIPFSAGVQTMTSAITFRNDKCVSVKRELYVGSQDAAHPSVFRIGEQFGLETGRVLGFADLVNDPARAVELFREAIPTYNATEVDGAVLAGLFLPDNFYLTDEGFTFWFQGEGLPANSPVEVTVPYEAGKDVLVSWIAP